MTDQISPYAPKPLDLQAALGGAKLIEYGEKVAEHIEKVGDELLRIATDNNAECRRLAADVRLMCQLQADRSRQIAERSRGAAVEITDVHKRFTLPLDEPAATPPTVEVVALQAVADAIEAKPEDKI